MTWLQPRRSATEGCSVAERSRSLAENGPRPWNDLYQVTFFPLNMML
jgi:hypothetical protein